MTEKLRQSLSAAIDDEADAFELRRVLDELGRDDELRALWGRYHLIGDALRGEPAPISGQLRDRIWEALESAPLSLPDAVDASSAAKLAAADPAATAAPVRSRLGRYTGLAVAATVAFAVVLGFNEFRSGDAPEVVDAAADSGVAAPLIATTVDAPGVRPEEAPAAELTAGSVSPRDVQRAQAYMLHHAQQQALNQAGVMSFVKLATYEAP